HRGGELPHAPRPAARRHACRAGRPGQPRPPVELVRQGDARRAVPPAMGPLLMTPAGEPTRAWRIQSLHLSYPDQHLLNRRPLLHAAVATLPKRIAGPLERFLDSLDRTPLPKLAADYVATFDHHKRFSLFLTYFTYGDTRKRGMALL